MTDRETSEVDALLNRFMSETLKSRVDREMDRIFGEVKPNRAARRKSRKSRNRHFDYPEDGDAWGTWERTGRYD